MPKQNAVRVLVHEIMSHGWLVVRTEAGGWCRFVATKGEHKFAVAGDAAESVTMLQTLARQCGVEFTACANNAHCPKT